MFNTGYSMNTIINQVSAFVSAFDGLRGPYTDQRGEGSGLLKPHNMETTGEIIPFAKEILNQKPSRGMLKVYVFGTTLAVLGLIGGLMETVCQQFAEYDTAEDEPVALIMEMKEENLELNCQTTLVRPDVADVHTILVDATHVMITGQRSSANRSHAS